MLDKARSAGNSLVTIPGLAFRLAKDRRHEKHDLEIVGIAAVLLCARTDVVAVFLHARNAAADRDHGIGMFCCKIASRRRSTRLQKRRSALRRTRRIERPARFEEFALEIDFPYFAIVRVSAGFSITDDGVVVPGIEKLVDEVHVLMGHFVALLAWWQTFEAEVLSRTVLGAGDDVPRSEAAIRQVVDRRG